MKKILSILIIPVFAGLLWLASCKKEASPTSQVSVMLKDAPAHCDKVNLQVSGAQLFVDGRGWVTIPFNERVIDILQFSDTSMLIGTVNLPLGTISQVRLLLGNGNSVVVGGFEFPLHLLTGFDDGLTIKISEKLKPGKFKLVIDFDAARSIFDEGDGHNFRIKGVLHEAFDEDNGGDEHHGGHDD